MKIGVFVPQGWRMDLNSIKLEDQWNTILEAASNIENLGYESIWVYDHFHTVPKPTQDPTYECWTLMSALSQTTSKVRLGQMCTCNSYRNPAYLTKVASNIDVMSNGRLEYAIGAGWYDHEYRAYGYEYPSAGIRLKMLEESLIIYKKMTTEETPSFNGEFYQIDGAINQPKPIQKPYPPLWVCGGGEKVTLKLLAKYGDYGNWDVDVDGFIQKSNILQNHCENVGRDFNEIGKTLHTNVLIADNQNDLDRKVEKLSTYTNIPKDYYYERPLIGTKDKVFETIDQYKEAGCIYLIAYIPDIVWGDTVNYLSELNQS
ncbi:MAG: TIGR03560 family F420-dependent LLM class oxidoreductase [Candidatus Actinomarinales bacterium]|jgi:F420-dependent oxidoreductase-like protein|nr:TIGR03560 family F420-dependent LLM class oxidoreductase [Candidatus Actinomarinales bacterium]